FYAVRQGRQPGIYSTWTECQANVQGFSGAVYKKFNTYEEAQSFCASGSISSSTLSQQNYNNKPSNAYAQVIPSNEGTNQSDLGSVTVVYTDGASSNNGYGNARAGYGVYWGENDSRN
ncbi:Caulimovirus viroplasmin-domain-containing protein, partial [Cokeromyces recurvatus]|uniref:Caulimovirus viroplasmin-domain-containing protein n=1 Tax=Cokeromyces recurvatus TaxID=90255 RepID=UPI00221E8B11